MCKRRVARFDLGRARLSLVGVLRALRHGRLVGGSGFAVGAAGAGAAGVATALL